MSGKALSRDAIYQIQVLKSFAIKELAANALIYNDTTTSNITGNDVEYYAYYYQGIDKKRIASLSDIVDYLLQLAWTDTSHFRKVAIDGLTTIAGIATTTTTTTTTTTSTTSTTTTTTTYSTTTNTTTTTITTMNPNPNTSSSNIFAIKIKRRIDNTTAIDHKGIHY